MALRDIYNSSIDTALTLSNASDRITSTEVKAAFGSALDYSDALLETLDAGTKLATSTMFMHNEHLNVTFVYDEETKRLKLSVAALPSTEGIVTANSTKLITSGGVAIALAGKEDKLPSSTNGVLDVLLGNKTWKKLTSALVPEDSDPAVNRKYFTEARVLSTPLSGYTLPATVSAIGITDTLIVAIAKLEKSLSSKQNTLIGTETTGQTLKTVNKISLLGAGNIDIGSSNTTVTGSSVVIGPLSSLSTLSGTSAPDAALRYRITDVGKEGEYRFVSGSTATADGVLVVTHASGRFFRIIDNNTVNLDWFLGMGLTSFSGVIENLASQGYKIIGNLGSTYPLGSPVDITDKHFYLDGNGCTFTFTTTSGNYAFNHESTLTNNDATVATYAGQYGTNMAFAAVYITGDVTAKFKIGMTVKVLSDDRYPYNTVPKIENSVVTDTAKTTNIYLAEYFNIYSSVYESANNRTVIRVEGQFANKYLTNIRLVPLKGWTANLRNFTLKTTGIFGGGIDLSGTHRPFVENVTFQELHYPGIVLRGCYCPIIEKINAPYVSTAEGNTKPGYLVNESGSYNTVLRDIMCNGRNMLSTNGGTTSTTLPSSLNTYGMSNAIYIEGVLVQHADLGIGGHSPGVNYVIRGARFLNCALGMKVRCQSMTMTDIFMNNCNNGIEIGWGTEDAEEVFPRLHYSIDGFTFINPVAIDPDNSPFAFAMVNPAHVNVGHAALGTTGSDTRVIIKNMVSEAPIDISSVDLCVIDGAFFDFKVNDSWYANWIEVRDAILRVSNLYVRSMTLTSFYGIYFNGSNTEVYMDKTCKYEVKDTTPFFCKTKDTSSTTAVYTNNKLIVDGLTWIGNGPVNDHLGNKIGVGYANTEMGYQELGAMNRLAYLSVSWRTETLGGTKSTRQSNYLEVKQRTDGTLLFQTKHLNDDHLFANVMVASANKVAAAFDAPIRHGQTLTIQNTSGNTIILPQQQGGANVTLTNGGVVNLLSVGSMWIYEGVPAAV